MPDPRLLSIGRAVPATRHTQRELYAHNPWGHHPLIDRLFLDSPIHSRALALGPEWYAEPRTLSDTNAAWEAAARQLAGRSLEDALASAAVDRERLDCIGVTTVTGYATPGLDLLLARDHGLRDDLARVHFNCIGCHAAVPLLRVLSDHVARRPGTLGAAVAVEVCSACFASDPEPQNLVAIALFADGAATAIVGTEGEGPRLLDFGSVYDFEHIDKLGFGLTAEGFRIVLDPSIPDRIAANIERAVDALLTRSGVRRDQVALWALHPGGSRILDATQSELGLSDAAMTPSRRVLRGYGNMSSPSVLFVLAEALTHAPPEPGTYGVLAAFGPGLGIEVALLGF
jgi:alkylresorcinol/alkylpyrone synthase